MSLRTTTIVPGVGRENLFHEAQAVEVISFLEQTGECPISFFTLYMPDTNWTTWKYCQEICTRKISSRWPRFAYRRERNQTLFHGKNCNSSADGLSVSNLFYAYKRRHFASLLCTKRKNIS